MPDVKPIPDGYPVATPVIMVSPCEDLVTFMKEVLGAEERLRMSMPNSQIGHCELIVNGGLIMVSDIGDPFTATQSAVHIYVDDVDATYQKALDRGSTSLMPPENMFYGDRSCAVRDPFGTTWNFSKHVEDVTEEDMNNRMQAMFQQTGQG